METFIWVTAIATGLTALSRVISLYTGEIPQRTPGTVAFDLGIDICMVVWAAVLLSS